EKAKMNKREEKGKSKKAILSIALAAVVLASVTIAMLGSIEAYSTGGPYNIIAKQTAAQRVLIGQDLDFSQDWGSNIVTVSRVKEGAVEWSQQADTQNHLTVSESEDQWTRDGAFFVNYIDATTWDAKLTVANPSMPLKLKVGTKEVTSIARGTCLTVDVGGINLFDNDKVDLVIIGPKGQITNKNGQTFTDITVSALTSFSGSGAIDTTNWDIGYYTFQVKTKPQAACGLDEQSPKRELNIIIPDVTIIADTTEVTELEIVKLTVRGVAGRAINVKADPSSQNVYFPAGIDNNPRDMTTNNFNDTIDDDGTRTYAVEFNDTGFYTIRVTDLDEVDSYDTVDITVTDKQVIFDMPATIAIGERVTIKGTVNTGYTVTIAVDDEVVQKLDNIVIDENGEFEVEIDTSACDSPAGFQIPGLVTLTACGAVGSTTVFMVRPWLTACLSTDIVEPGDEFTISGAAKGSKCVDILIVAPKGYSGTNIEDSSYKEMYIGSTGVSATDGRFLKKIEVGRYVDTGRYLVVVLTKGSNEYYGSGADWCTIEDALCDYSLRTRTKDEMLAVLDDILELSDDLIWVGYVTVGEQETLTLNPIADVVTGDTLVVTGESSRKEGTRIWITVKGRYFEIVPQAAYVTDNTFDATFDTTGAPPGVYAVQVMDGYGYTATTKVHIYTEGEVPTSFDTGEGSYPSIRGAHNGTITIQRRQWW
ncbi:hypothetical protein C5S31_01695, partial [ANME-1 cluster archaeon GoMg2]|nr:hypothetical protein [ANME-1 cluster archaeon GoMg2]